MSTRALTKPDFASSLFDDFFKSWSGWLDHSRIGSAVVVPAVNINEASDRYTVSLAVPGLKKEDLKIDIEGSRLTVSSERQESKEEKEENYSHREYSYAAFSRSFTLPEDVRNEAIEARYENGELSISLPRKEDTRKTIVTRQIAVR